MANSEETLASRPSPVSVPLSLTYACIVPTPDIVIVDFRKLDGPQYCHCCRIRERERPPLMCQTPQPIKGT
jgi:hypothetical protein